MGAGGRLSLSQDVVFGNSLIALVICLPVPVPVSISCEDVVLSRPSTREVLYISILVHLQQGTLQQAIGVVYRAESKEQKVTKYQNKA
jgi:hypothetical protein